MAAVGAAAGRGRLRGLAAERPQRAGDRRGGRASAGGGRLRQLRRRLPGRPGGSCSATAARSGSASWTAAASDRVDALVARHRGRRGHRQRARLPVGEAGLRRDAVRDRGQRPLDRRRARRAALPAAVHRARARGAGRRAGHRRSRSTASTPPTSRARSSAWSSSTGGRRRPTRASTATWPCATGATEVDADPRPGRRAAGAAHGRADPRHRGRPPRCERANLDLLAAYERLGQLGAPLNAVTQVVGAPDRAASGPLAGVPVAVKDNIDMAGVVTTNASTVGRAAAGRAGRGRGRRPARGRRRPVLQDQPAGVRRGQRQPGVRHDLQPARPGAHRRAGRAAARRRWSRPASATTRSAPTPAARSASRRATAASSGSSRRPGCCRWTACSRCRRAATRVGTLTRSCTRRRRSCSRPWPGGPARSSR